MSKGKFLVEAYKSFDSSKFYNFNDAVNILLKNKRTKINETIEISLNLGIDPRHADQMVRGTVNLPNGSGKEIKLAVFAKDKNAKSNFGAKNIVENINSFVDTIKKSRPSGAKGTFINKISLSSTMGVSVNCEIN